MRITGAVRPGSATAARAGERQTGSSTPASRALASGAGMAAMARSKGRESPATAVSTPATTNAPSAAA